MVLIILLYDLIDFLYNEWKRTYTIMGIPFIA